MLGRKLMIQLVTLLLLPGVATTEYGSKTDPIEAVVGTAEYTGSIGQWILQFDPDDQPHFADTYRDLYSALPSDCSLIVVVPKAEEFDAFMETIGISEIDPRVRVVDIKGRVSCWSRDRYIPFVKSGRRYVLLPRELEILEERKTELSIGRALPSLSPGVEIIESKFDIEGGNVLLDLDHVLIGAETIEDNLEQFDQDSDAVLSAIESVFGREPVVVGDVDSGLVHAHIDMFVTIIGPRRALVGDPRLSQSLFRVRELIGTESTQVRDIGEFSEETQSHFEELYEGVVNDLTDAGFEVTRIPILHGDGGEVLTWNNAVLEVRDGKRIAYVPRYDVPLLDEAAFAVWEAAGYSVKPLRSELIITRGGAIRCLTNVVERRSSPPVNPATSKL